MKILLKHQERYLAHVYKYEQNKVWHKGMIFDRRKYASKFRYISCANAMSLRAKRSIIGQDKSYNYMAD